MAEILSMEHYWVQNVLEIFTGFQSLLPNGRLEIMTCPGRSCALPSRHRFLWFCSVFMDGFKIQSWFFKLPTIHPLRF